MMAMVVAMMGGVLTIAAMGVPHMEWDELPSWDDEKEEEAEDEYTMVALAWAVVVVAVVVADEDDFVAAMLVNAAVAAAVVVDSVVPPMKAVAAKDRTTEMTWWSFNRIPRLVLTREQPLLNVCLNDDENIYYSHVYQLYQTKVAKHSCLLSPLRFFRQEIRFIQS